jgi:hypothetical protein
VKLAQRLRRAIANLIYPPRVRVTLMTRDIHMPSFTIELAAKPDIGETVVLEGNFHYRVLEVTHRPWTMRPGSDEPSIILMTVAL